MSFRKKMKQAKDEIIDFLKDCELKNGKLQPDDLEELDELIKSLSHEIVEDGGEYGHYERQAIRIELKRFALDYVRKRWEKILREREKRIAKRLSLFFQ